VSIIRTTAADLEPNNRAIYTAKDYIGVALKAMENIDGRTLSRPVSAKLANIKIIFLRVLAQAIFL
jgi:hypothetical protein